MYIFAKTHIAKRSLELNTHTQEVNATEATYQTRPGDYSHILLDSTQRQLSCGAPSGPVFLLYLPPLEVFTNSPLAHVEGDICHIGAHGFICSVERSGEASGSGNRLAVLIRVDGAWRPLALPRASLSQEYCIFLTFTLMPCLCTLHF